VTEVPGQYSLKCSSANPFNPAVEIEYGLPEQANVSLNVYGVGGTVVRRLVQAGKAAGFYRAVWDGTDDAGKRVASGVYFLKLETARHSETEKILLLK
jgi:flagellar hook assembly protein FlgD